MFLFAEFGNSNSEWGDDVQQNKILFQFKHLNTVVSLILIVIFLFWRSVFCSIQNSYYVGICDINDIFICRDGGDI